MDSLDLRYAKSVLLRTLRNHGPCQVSDYLEIASNWRTLQDVIDALVKDKYLFKEEKIDKRRRYEVNLTLKGTRVAKLLRFIEGIPNLDTDGEIVVFLIPDKLILAIFKAAGLDEELKLEADITDIDPYFMEDELVKFSIGAIKERVKTLERKKSYKVQRIEKKKNGLSGNTSERLERL